MPDANIQDSQRDTPPEPDTATMPKPMDERAFNELVERLYTKLKPLAARVQWSPKQLNYVFQFSPECNNA